MEQLLSLVNLKGFNYIGIEMEEQYYKIAESRIENCEKDNETIETILANEDVKQVFNIFDFIGEEAGKEQRKKNESRGATNERIGGGLNDT